MLNAVALFFHVVAAAVFVGPQVLLLATMPRLRTVADGTSRQQVTRLITTTFGWLGGGALVLLVVTGIINYEHARDLGLIEREQFPRYFWALQIKLTLVTLVIILTAVHAGVLGRRLLRLQETGAGEDEIAAARRWSMAVSAATFVASLAILFCAALLASSWSKA